MTAEKMEHFSRFPRLFNETWTHSSDEPLARWNWVHGRLYDKHRTYGGSVYFINSLSCAVSTAFHLLLHQFRQKLTALLPLLDDRWLADTLHWFMDCCGCKVCDSCSCFAFLSCYSTEQAGPFCWTLCQFVVLQTFYLRIHFRHLPIQTFWRRGNTKKKEIASVKLWWYVCYCHRKDVALILTFLELNPQLCGGLCRFLPGASWSSCSSKTDKCEYDWRQSGVFFNNYIKLKVIKKQLHSFVWWNMQENRLKTTE